MISSIVWRKKIHDHISGFHKIWNGQEFWRILTLTRIYFAKFHFHLDVFPRNTGLGTDIFIKLEYIARSLVKIKSIPDWHLFISRMETKWTKWCALTLHVIAYRSLELLFRTHTFHFNCFFDYFNCVFTQIRCLSRVLEAGEARTLGPSVSRQPLYHWAP